ncbi:acyl-CoA dehydrogenase family protein [Cryptosporangium aurantiacum]|uniref:Acyl-CoA dehydrogenase n=1 Tax=Cryptosporangium aurantiacum TaxID=134849 RepID=A0A1M7RJS5_9ACTN|nr:acyl-CoA dehydrogenase family protein [Cryptosporangium aurantiacum]SHN46557.1 acyl-CoA dehydrogenase [Cryptosporangium aurantiacum]
MDAADLAEIVAAVRTFVRNEVVPREEEIDATDAVPDTLVAACKEMGLYGFTIPTAYGGLGLSVAQECELVFELGWTTPALRSLFGTNNGIAGHVLLEGGTEEQKKVWLPRLASGEVTASFALTEADAGSDPSALTTRARREGNRWVLDGAKRYITNAPVADVFMVFARTDPDAPGNRGITAFLVPADTPGVSVGTPDRKMGQFGAHTADVYLDEVILPGDAVVGGDQGVNNGFRIAAQCLAHGRIHIAALCVGMAGRLVSESVEFAQSRRAGGKPIARFQLVQGLVADSVTDHYAGRALVLDVARAYDAGTDRITGPAAAKYFCSEMVGRVADRAVQIHGGAGYMRGVAVERFYRDARLFRIYEGTSQIQQVIIARQTLGPAARD